jgi:hypothetical protein
MSKSGPCREYDPLSKAEASGTTNCDASVTSRNMGSAALVMPISGIVFTDSDVSLANLNAAYLEFEILF